MADLAALFGKKTTPVAKEESNEKAEAQTQAATGGQEQAADSTPEQSAAAPKPVLAGLGFLGKPAVAAADGQESVRVPDGEAAKVLTLDDLDSSTEQGVVPKTPVPFRFADEVPATAPVRELPADLEPTQKAFIDLIDGVYGLVHEPDILGNVIKSIMIELKSQPQYIKLIAPEDVRTWIKAMRDTMGLAKIQKAEKKAKTSGRGKSTKVDSDMLDDLASLGLDLG